MHPKVESRGRTGLPWDSSMVFSGRLCAGRIPRMGCALVMTLMAWPAGATEGAPGWAAVTASPVPGSEASLDSLERAALAQSGPGDSGLHGTALAGIDRHIR